MKRFIAILVLLTFIPLMGAIVVFQRTVPDRMYLTPEGGIALKYTAREPIPAFKSVQLASGSVILTIPATPNGSGVSYDTIASGDAGWIVVHGRAEVKVNEPVLSGYVAISPTTGLAKGGIYMGDGVPPTEHDYEIGHFESVAASGANTFLLLHWN